MQRTINIPMFEGFYYSIWSNMIEDEERSQKEWIADQYDIDMDEMEDFGGTQDWNDKAQQAIIEAYADIYIDQIRQYLDLDFHIEGKVEMSSPRYYNYTTDKIYVTVSYDGRECELYNKIIALMDKHRDELQELVRHYHTSYDGFWSFMSNDASEWKKRLGLKDEMYLDYVLLYLLYLENKAKGHYRSYEVGHFKDDMASFVAECIEFPAFEFGPYYDSDQEKFDEFQEKLKAIDKHRAAIAAMPTIPGL